MHYRRFTVESGDRRWVFLFNPASGVERSATRSMALFRARQAAEQHGSASLREEIQIDGEDDLTWITVALETIPCPTTSSPAT